MKTNLKLSIISALMTLLLTACRNDNLEEKAQELRIDQPSEYEKNCGFVDGSWSPTAELKDNLRESTQTSFLNSQLNNITNVLWGGIMFLH